MRQDCCREYDKSQRSRESAIAAFDHARQEMMACKVITNETQLSAATVGELRFSRELF
jgi:hypothetical protein